MSVYSLMRRHRREFCDEKKMCGRPGETAVVFCIVNPSQERNRSDLSIVIALSSQDTQLHDTLQFCVVFRKGKAFELTRITFYINFECLEECLYLHNMSGMCDNHDTGR